MPAPAMGGSNRTLARTGVAPLAASRKSSDMALLAGGAPVLVHAAAEQRFKITPAQLRAAMTEQTKLVVINSPSNPTGMAYTSDELAALARCCGSSRVR